MNFFDLRNMSYALLEKYERFFVVFFPKLPGEEEYL